MGLIPEQDHLTVLDAGFESSRRATYPGMAHFSGSGPVGKTCRECIFWTGCGTQSGYHANTKKHGGVIKPRSCEKFRQMMRGELGASIPHSARACKYFEQNADAPSIVRQNSNQ